MNELIVYFILFYIIVYIYRTNKKNNNDDNNDNYTNINNNLLNETHNKHISVLSPNHLLIKPQWTTDSGDTPAFRGFTDEYYLEDKNEIGGSKSFSNIELDDNNLLINEVNYKTYESYRKKPKTLKDL